MKFRKFALLISIVFFLMTLFSCIEKLPIDDKDEDSVVEVPGEQLYDILGEYPESMKQAIVINASGLSHEEYIMVTSLQGIVAKTAPSIYIGVQYYDEHLKYINDNFSGYTTKMVNDPWMLVSMFKEHLNENGYVLYKRSPEDIPPYPGLEGKLAPNHFKDTTNIAATIAGIDGYLMIEESQATKAISAGLVEKADARVINSLDAVRQFFRDNKEKLNPEHTLHMFADRKEMRDIAIALGAFTFFTDESLSQRTFRREVFQWMEADSPVWGWSFDELPFVQDMSLYGNYSLPSDWSSNISYLAGVRKGGPVLQPYKTRNIVGLNDKHYVAIVVSDGDNVQWAMRDFAGDPTKNLGLRIARHKEANSTRPDFRLTWTFPPSLGEIAEPVVRHIYSRVNPDKDSFISGVSGVGYGNPLTYFPDQYIPAYAESTARHMKQAGLDIISLLDNINEIRLKAATSGKSFEVYAQEQLHHYAKNEEIKGGIWMLDPSRYEGGTGSVFWSNDKPFISVRLALWHPSGNAANTTNEWIESIANRVNSFSRDYYEIGGYSVINVHPWTVNLDFVEHFVSKLAPHVEIISASELVDMVSRNVTKEYYNPGNTIPV